jgi:hypothetical protein
LVDEPAELTEQSGTSWLGWLLDGHVAVAIFIVV